MNIPLTIRQKGSFLYYSIPIWYRCLSAIILGSVIGAIIISGGTGIPGWIILAITAFAFFYEEKWVFNKSTGQCYSRMGLVFLYKGPSFSAEDVDVIRIDIFCKGYIDQGKKPQEGKMPPGSQIRFIIDLKNGDSFLLNSVALRKKTELTENARTIASFMNFKME